MLRNNYLKIGDSGIIKGLHVTCLDGTKDGMWSCDNCVFFNRPTGFCFDIPCTPSGRKDLKWVIFQQTKEL